MKVDNEEIRPAPVEQLDKGINLVICDRFGAEVNSFTLRDFTDSCFDLS
jgi:hypothetical protein